MSITKETLRLNIKEAFNNTCLENGVGLFEAQALDDYLSNDAQAEYRSRDEKIDWKNISS